MKNKNTETELSMDMILKMTPEVFRDIVKAQSLGFKKSLLNLLKMNFEQCIIAKEGITTLLAKDQLEGQEKENAEKLLADLYTSMQLIEDRHTILDILINENNKELNN